MALMGVNSSCRLAYRIRLPPMELIKSVLKTNRDLFRGTATYIRHRHFPWSLTISVAHASTSEIRRLIMTLA